MKQKTGFIICSTGWGGLEMNVLKLAEWLRERGQDIEFYAVKDTRISAEVIKSSFNTHIIKNHKNYFDFTGAYRFKHLLQQHNINQVMVFDNRDLDFVFLTKCFLLNKFKVIYLQQMQIGITKRDFIHTLRYSSIDYWVTPLECLKNEVKEKTRFNHEKIRVIPLCIEIDGFITKKYSKTEARQKLELEANIILLGIIGRIDNKKGQLFLVKAVHELQKRNTNVNLLIIGEPTVNDPESKIYLANLHQYIEKHNLQNRIFIKNFTSDVQLFYNAIDIFCLASQAETFGMVTIEAMLSGLPIIATNTPSTAEILNYGELGLLYQPEDTNDFCNKLAWLLEHKNEFGEKAQQAAIAKFRHTKECEEIEKLL